jgi:hypothetical protein
MARTRDSGQSQIANRKSQIALALLVVGGLVVGCGGGSGKRATLTITPGRYSLSQEQSREFQAVLRDKDGAVVKNPTIVWTLDPANLGELTNRSRQTRADVTVRVVSLQIPADAEVGTTGKLKARSEDPPAEATANLRVVEDLDRLEIQPTRAALLLGQTRRFTVQAFDAENNPVDNFLPYWTAESVPPAQDVGTIAQTGLFTAQKPGRATVTVQGSWADPAQAEVTVVDANALLVIDPALAFVEKNTERQFRAFLEDEAGNRREVQPTWGVTGNIGTIETSGRFTAGNAVGQGQVTARAEGQTAEAEVRVVEVAPPPGAPTNVEGTVRAAGGSGLPSATVEARNAAGSVVATAGTDANGRYQLWLPAGTWTLQATAAGYQAAEQKITLETQNLRRTGVNFALEPE